MNILKRRYLFILFICIILGLEQNAYAHGGAEALIPLGILFVVILIPFAYFTAYFVDSYKIKYIFRNPEEKKNFLKKKLKISDIAVNDMLILAIGIFGPVLLLYTRSIFSITVAKYNYLISYLLICLLVSFMFNINLTKEKSVSLTEYLKNKKNLFRTILMSLPIILIILIIFLSGIFSIFVLGLFNPS